MISVTEAEVDEALTMGINIHPNHLATLSEAEADQLILAYYTKVASRDLPATHVDMPIETNNLTINGYNITKELIASGKRGSFSEALEAAFWNLGGVHFLEHIGKTQPLEFLKIAAKLVPMEIKAQDANSGVHIIMTLHDPATAPIEGESTKLEK